MSEKKVEQYDVVIIGGGAAGLTAGIYAGRARLNTLIIEQALIGGLATNTNDIENYPGFPEGESGKGLMDLFHKQAKKFGVKFKLTDVRSVDFDGDVKKVETFRNIFEAKVVIVAAGGRPRITGASNEELYMGKGIAFCATCDAAANTGQTVVVVGSGDAAIEEGIFLSKFADKVVVSIIHDTGKMDCNEIAKAAALSNEKMDFQWNTVVSHFEGDEVLHNVVLKNLKTGELIPVDCHTCFEFIGYIPNTEIYKGILDMTDKGYLLANEMMETNMPGVFAAGDVREKFLRQVATCVGDGAIAGVAAEKYIAEGEAFEHQIMRKDKHGVAFVYNAAEADQRGALSVMEVMEKETAGKYHFSRIDVYKSKGLAHRLGVAESPAVAIIKDGKVAKIMPGLPVQEDILKALQ